MRKTYFFLLLLMPGFCTSLQAQITVTNTTFPRLGDTLFFAFDVNPNVNAFTPPGGDQTWDFSSLKPTFTQQQIFKSPATGTAAAAFPGANLLYVNNNIENYLNVTNQTVQAVGYFGVDPIGIGIKLAAPYSPPIIERRAPLNFFDIYQISSGLLLPLSINVVPDSIVRRLPVRPDSLRIRIALNRLDVVDAWGSVRIPGGTYPVLREKRTQYTETRLDAKVPPLGWLDITDVAIQTLRLSNLGVDTTVAYHFWNNTSKEPIAVVTLNEDQATSRLVQYKLNRMTTDVKSLNQASLQWSVFPNPATDRVQLRFSNLEIGQYQLKIYDVSGAAVGQASYRVFGKTLEAYLEVTSFKSGMYLLQLFDNQGYILGFHQIVIAK
jgi:hypothetical protein